MSDSITPNPGQTPVRAPVLPYQRQITIPVVTVRTFYDAMEAQLYANQLEAAGIDYNLTNTNTNTLGPYAAFSQVELQVRQEDSAEASALLSQLQLDPADLEPERDVDPAAPLADPMGDGVLVPAAAYDNPRPLYDAAAALGAAHIECFLPVLVPRGDRPVGSGNRFVIRVREQDLPRARDALARQPEASDDEPRCPRCGSWRTYPIPEQWRGLVSILFGRTPEQPRQLECLKCHHRWPIHAIR